MYVYAYICIRIYIHIRVYIYIHIRIYIYIYIGLVSPLIHKSQYTFLPLPSHSLQSKKQEIHQKNIYAFLFCLFPPISCQQTTTLVN